MKIQQDHQQFLLSQSQNDKQENQNKLVSKLLKQKQRSSNRQRKEIPKQKTKVKNPNNPPNNPDKTIITTPEKQDISILDGIEWNPTNPQIIIDKTIIPTPKKQDISILDGKESTKNIQTVQPLSQLQLLLKAETQLKNFCNLYKEFKEFIIKNRERLQKKLKETPEFQDFQEDKIQIQFLFRDFIYQFKHLQSNTNKQNLIGLAHFLDKCLEKPEFNEFYYYAINQFLLQENFIKREYYLGGVSKHSQTLMQLYIDDAKEDRQTQYIIQFSYYINLLEIKGHALPFQILLGLALKKLFFSQKKFLIKNSKLLKKTIIKTEILSIFLFSLVQIDPLCVYEKILQYSALESLDYEFHCKTCKEKLNRQSMYHCYKCQNLIERKNALMLQIFHYLTSQEINVFTVIMFHYLVLTSQEIQFTVINTEGKASFELDYLNKILSFYEEKIKNYKYSPKLSQDSQQNTNKQSEKVQDNDQEKLDKAFLSYSEQYLESIKLNIEKIEQFLNLKQHKLIQQQKLQLFHQKNIFFFKYKKQQPNDANSCIIVQFIDDEDGINRKSFKKLSPSDLQQINKKNKEAQDQLKKQILLPQVNPNPKPNPKPNPNIPNIHNNPNSFGFFIDFYNTIYNENSNQSLRVANESHKFYQQFTKMFKLWNMLNNLVFDDVYAQTNITNVQQRNIIHSTLDIITESQQQQNQPLFNFLIHLFTQTYNEDIKWNIMKDEKAGRFYQSAKETDLSRIFKQIFIIQILQQKHYPQFLHSVVGLCSEKVIQHLFQQQNKTDYYQVLKKCSEPDWPAEISETQIKMCIKRFEIYNFILISILFFNHQTLYQIQKPRFNLADNQTQTNFNYFCNTCKQNLDKNVLFVCQNCHLKDSHFSQRNQTLLQEIKQILTSKEISLFSLITLFYFNNVQQLYNDQSFQQFYQQKIENKLADIQGLVDNSNPIFKSVYDDYSNKFYQNLVQQMTQPPQSQKSIMKEFNMQEGKVKNLNKQQV